MHLLPHAGTESQRIVNNLWFCIFDDDSAVQQHSSITEELAASMIKDAFDDVVTASSNEHRWTFNSFCKGLAIHTAPNSITLFLNRDSIRYSCQ